MVRPAIPAAEIPEVVRVEALAVMPVVMLAETPVAKRAVMPMVMRAETPVAKRAVMPVVMRAETPVVIPAETPVVMRAETPVVIPAETLAGARVAMQMAAIARYFECLPTAARRNSIPKPRTR
jgi:hypothetical protein